MLHKNFPFEFKSLDEAGTFEATVAVFGNVDKGGDRIIPGAFAKTLAQWEASGDPIPVIFNHDWASPDAHIGVVEKAIETSQGLLVKGRLDIADNPVAKQVHRLMQRRSLKEFSFGYSVPKGGEKVAKDGANDLTQIDLAEVGPTLKGMNPATELHSVKSALGVEELRDPTEVREAARRTAREIEQQGLPDVPKQPAESEPDFKAELQVVKDALVEMRRLVEEATKKPPVDAQEQREAAKRAAREIEQHTIPEVPASSPERKRLASDVREQLDAAGADRFGRTQDKWVYLDDYDPDAKWAVFSVSNSSQSRYVRIDYTLNSDGSITLGDTETDVVRTTSYRPATGGKAFSTSELQGDLKSELAETRRELEALKEKADATDKEPRKARSVDPLRKQAEAMALEIASDGQSLRKPPKTVTPTPPDLVPLDELRRRMRDEMLGVLSGGITE